MFLALVPHNDTINFDIYKVSDKRCPLYSNQFIAAVNSFISYILNNNINYDTLLVYILQTWIIFNPTQAIYRKFDDYIKRQAIILWCTVLAINKYYSS